MCWPLRGCLASAINPISNQPPLVTKLSRDRISLRLPAVSAPFLCLPKTYRLSKWHLTHPLALTPYHLTFTVGLPTARGQYPNRHLFLLFTQQYDRIMMCSLCRWSEPVDQSNPTLVFLAKHATILLSCHVSTYTVLTVCTTLVYQAPHC